ncbi:DUF4132 domain-containing protein [Aureivirga sp. CE67]|uniref:DUF4132 domain-containing protein n=1 Tax=Aureivirga sp. CE67 TaxID=1788983 RepID=UPI0018C9EC22|nr:DUF4132 domain-containing protein [Aureivirga sp. CE67]
MERNELQNFLQKRQRRNHVKKLREECEKGISNFSEEQVLFTQILVDPAKFGIKVKDRYYNQLFINYYGKRYNELLKIREKCVTNDIFESEYYEVLEYIFGEEFASYLHEYWKVIPTLPFQSGYARRSFRVAYNENEQIAEDIFIDQLNFIVRAIEHFKYNLSLEEFLKFSYTYEISSFTVTELFTGAILAGNKDFEQLLISIVLGEHETYKVSHSVIKALLVSQSEEGVEAVKKLLLAAQRQEGLRQTILETVDQCPLNVFKDFVVLINREKMHRFASVVRAFDTWTGLELSAENQSQVKKFFHLAEHFLEEKQAIKSGVFSNDSAEAYMALWALATEDVNSLEPYLIDLANDDRIQKKLLAFKIANETKLRHFANLVAEPNLHFDHLQIQCEAVRVYDNYKNTLSLEKKQEYTNVLVKLIQVIPKEGKVFKSKLFNWQTYHINLSNITTCLLSVLDLKKPEDCRLVFPIYEKGSVDTRRSIMYAVLDKWGYRRDGKKKAEILPHQREFAFQLLEDKSIDLKTEGIDFITKTPISFEELPVFVGLLKSKSAQLKKKVSHLILEKNFQYSLWFTNELLQQKTVEQRVSGLDYLVELQKQENILELPITHQQGVDTEEEITYGDWIQETVKLYQEKPKLSKKEKETLDLLVQSEESTLNFSLENGYGGIYSFDPVKKYNSKDKKEAFYDIISEHNILENIDITKEFKFSKSYDEVVKDIEELLALMKANETFEYTYENYSGGKETVLFGSYFQQISREKNKDNFYLENYPLAELWDAWYKNTGLTTKDLCLLNLLVRYGRPFSKNFPQIYQKVDMFMQPLSYNREKVIADYYLNNVIALLHKKYAYENQKELYKILYFSLVNCVPKEDFYTDQKVGYSYKSWKDTAMISHVEDLYFRSEKDRTDEEFTLFWKVTQWDRSFSEEQSPDKYNLMGIRAYGRALDLGLITKDELYWASFSQTILGKFTGKIRRRFRNDQVFETELGKALEEYPILKEVRETVLNRVLEIEFERTVSETSVSRLIPSISKIYRIDLLFKFIDKLGKEVFNRGGVGYWNRNPSLKENFSHLIEHCFPKEEDTQELFNSYVKSSKISQQKLVDLGMFAPQWLPFVEANLKWEMTSAVWWLQAHTKDESSKPSEEKIAMYSKISINDFNNGAVDVDWFKKSYKALGKKKWEMLYKSAKYISLGGQKRAQLYADVILGKTKITEVRKRVKDKRNQDYLRVYGLVPLSRANPEKDMLTRYQFLQHFLKESKQFGSQRQASEKLATQISMENLARTAGFPDPIRLTWAMEAKEAAQILENAVLELDNVRISLEIDEIGKASLKITRNDKTLKSIPAKLRKNKEVVALKNNVKRLQEQYRRTRKSLEEAMISGDLFKVSEVENLMQHPVISPIIKDLVFISGENHGFWKDGKLVSPNAETVEISEDLQIAHCTDLYATKQWSAYQRYCFVNEVRQPFKQIFRELYLPTEDEKEENHISRRYAGHQIQTRKTMALLKTQGWILDYEEGLQKVFHNENFMVNLMAYADWYYPSDVESPTIEGIAFYKRNSWSKTLISDISPRVFSEIMRDIDLVVSVAHVGEVDPETSQSSIELRASIARETAMLFKLDNVTFKEKHIIIKGKHQEYSLHLGSGITHKIAGSTMHILPVHSQHRGKIFLPFVDDDPKTAEIISKMLLLAKDDKIQDPTIIRQIMEH